MNCNKANYIGHSVLNSLVASTAIILFQEPWLGKIGTARSDTTPGLDVYGQVHQKTWNQFIPVPHLAGTDPPARVSAYVNKHLHPSISILQRTDLIQHLNIIVLEVRSRDLNLLVVNVYNDENCSALDVLLQSSLPPLPTIITGDFNLHHPAWSLPHTPESTRSDSLIHWMETNGFILLNEPEQITFEQGLSTSVLDLTWASQSALNKVTDWTIHTNASFSSDHKPVTWRYGKAPNPPDESAPKFNFKEGEDSIRGDWIEALETALSKKPTPFSFNPSLDQLHVIINHFHQSLHDASVATALAKPAHPSPSPWWTTEVTIALRSLRKAKKLFRKHRNRTTDIQIRLAAFQGVIRSRNKLRCVIAKAKRDWAYHFVSQVEANKIWSLNAWYKGIR